MKKILFILVVLVSLFTLVNCQNAIHKNLIVVTVSNQSAGSIQFSGPGYPGLSISAGASRDLGVEMGEIYNIGTVVYAFYQNGETYTYY